MTSTAAPATAPTTKHALAVKKAKRAGHISMLDSDTLTIVLLAFLNAEPNGPKDQIEKMATLREITKGWAEFFARRLYDKTAAVLYTSRMTQGHEEDTLAMSRNDAINSACALSLDSMGYLMYNQVSAYLPPTMCFAMLRLLMRFADADHAERLRLIGLGVGLSEDKVAEVTNNFPILQGDAGGQPEAQA